jgi:hypothetical protein
VPGHFITSVVTQRTINSPIQFPLDLFSHQIYSYYKMFQHYIKQNDANNNNKTKKIKEYLFQKKIRATNLMFWLKTRIFI